jgi:hypothetical protein
VDEEHLKSFVDVHSHEIGANYAAYNSSKHTRLFSTLPFFLSPYVLNFLVLLFSFTVSFSFHQSILYILPSVFSLFFSSTPYFSHFFQLILFFLAKKEKISLRKIRKVTKRSVYKTMGIKIRKWVKKRKEKQRTKDQKKKKNLEIDLRVEYIIPCFSAAYNLSTAD